MGGAVVSGGVVVVGGAVVVLNGVVVVSGAVVDTFAIIKKKHQNIDVAIILLDACKRILYNIM